jgi:hypothetical protein
MPRLEVLIPIIFIAVWILSSLLRKAEEENKTDRARRLPGGQGGPRPTRRPMTEIDRFLEEVNRRRQALERQGTQGTSPKTPAPGGSSPVVVPGPRARSTRQPATRVPPPPPVTIRVPSQNVPSRAPELEPILLEVAQPTPSPLPSLLAPGSPIMSREPDARDLSAVASQITTLLSAENGLRNAILLHEILGSPRCRQNGLPSI